MKVARARPLAPRIGDRRVPRRGRSHGDRLGSRCRRRSRRSPQGTPPVAEPGLRRPGRAAASQPGALRFTTDAGRRRRRRRRRLGHLRHAGRRRRSRRRRVRRRRRSRALFPHLQRRRARADLVAAAGRHDARGSSAHVARRSRRPRASSFACSPENLRLGKAIEVFTQPGSRRRRRARPSATAQRLDGAARADHRSDRVDVGRVGRDDQARDQRVSGDVGDVHQRDRRALRAGRRRREGSRARAEDARRGSGRSAYLVAGRRVRRRHAGARRRVPARSWAQRAAVPTPLMDGVESQQRAHRRWAAAAARSELLAALAGHDGRGVGADLQAGHRHAAAIERRRAVPVARWTQGAAVRAHDPAVRALPADLAARRARADAARRGRAGADALVVATEWPEYREVAADDARRGDGAAARARRQPVPRRDARRATRGSTTSAVGKPRA